MDEAQKKDYLDSLDPNGQLHHVNTKYEPWASITGPIVAKYGLDLKDEWNEIMIPHAGKHHVNYNSWATANVIAIDNHLSKNPETVGSQEDFLALHEQLVKNPVEADPSIVNFRYWDC